MTCLEYPTTGAVRAGSASGRLGRPGDWLAAAICVLIGITLSILPHLLWWPEVGAPVWVADNDELLYLAYAGQAHDNHPARLGDPIRATEGISMYPWLQFVPGILLAKGLGLGPMAISLVWRVWAGMSISLAWYLLIRRYVATPFWAAVVVAVLLADVGQLTGHLFIKQFALLGEFISGQAGQLLAGKPDFHSQWRIITPGLSLMCLLLYVWSLARAREKPAGARFVCSGAAFGLLFFVYFYYWTAAGLGLVLAFCLDRGYRRTYFHTAWLGGLIGVPAIASGFLLRHSTPADWGLRNDYFLPIPRFSDLLLPKLAILLLAVSLIWVWMRRRDLLFLWALAAAGLALTNHQIVTGLQISNFHWSYVWGPGISLLLVLLLVGEVRGRGWAKPAVWGVVVLCVVHLAAGFWLRVVEATRTTECVALTRTYEKYDKQRLGSPVARLAPNAVMAGDRGFVDLAAILENQRPLYHYAVDISPSVVDSEWNTRIALNGFLRGLDRAAFETEQKREVAGWVLGPWPRNHQMQAELLANRLACYDHVTANLAAVLDQFRITYVAFATGQARPAYLDSGWRQLEEGPYWSIWERGQARAERSDR